MVGLLRGADVPLVHGEVVLVYWQEFFFPIFLAQKELDGNLEEWRAPPPHRRTSLVLREQAPSHGAWMLCSLQD